MFWRYSFGNHTIEARSLIAILVLAIFAGALWGGQRGEQRTRIAFLQVAQGDCTVFQHRGWTMVVDPGPRNDKVDTTERLGVPQLYGLGVRSISLMILTHPDADHIGGLPALARRFRIERIMMPAAFRGHQDLKFWLDLAGLSEDNISWVQSHEDLRIDDWQIHFECPPPTSLLTENEGSMVVRIARGPASCLLMGDAGIAAEAFYLGKGIRWPSDILKAGHHGSNSSTSPDWLSMVCPKDVIISCGRNNVYGHPTKPVLENISRSGANILRTDRDGTITYEIGADGRFTRKLSAK